jgi:hypothetical protein
MKRIITVLILTVFISTPVFAHPTIDKAKGGLKDIITSPLEVRDHVKAETDKGQFMPFEMVGGFLKGGFYMAKKIVTGTLDVVTSPLEIVKK